MSYKKITIRKIITQIDENKIYLPALQRKFVWDKPRIELLFDSLMRNYPFGTFLLWKLHRQKADSYVFYEFLKEYDERHPYNRRKTGAFLHEEITGILDGQQRLSSMYIGLMGTHTEKAPYKRKSSSNAYEKTSLYLNLLSLPYYLDPEGNIATLEEKNFEFRFLTDEKVTTNTTRKIEREDGSTVMEPMLWFKVGQVLGWNEDPEFDQIIEVLQSECRTELQKETLVKQKRLIKKGLDTLHRRVHQDELVNYFEVVKDDLEDILKIFVRVNSGAMPLSKPDLLFSTIVATWDDGREEIEDLLKKINAKGDGFDFGNEYLMRCCLILSDGPAIYKVNSFKPENVEKIRSEWKSIAGAIEKTVDLLHEFGFSGSVLTSQNATIPVAYYLYKGGDTSATSKAGMRKYLIHALINGIFGSAQDQLLAVLRNALREEVRTGSGTTYKGRYTSFSFDEILKIQLPQQKSLNVTAPDIERFLQYKKGAQSFFVLALLYPQLRYNEVQFHQDHIHPASRFNPETFLELGLTPEQKAEWLDCRDCVPNLQFMEGGRNESKNATPFKEWFEKMDEASQEKFVRDNYLPEGVGLSFENFKEFFDRRKEKLRKELEKVLAITNKELPEPSAEWDEREEETIVAGVSQ